MAPSLSQANRLFTLHRRWYGVVCDGSSVRGAMDGIVKRSGMVKRKVEDKTGSSEASSSSANWAPDPVTGYYRPINHTNEIDPVELRNILLNHKPKSASPSP